MGLLGLVFELVVLASCAAAVVTNILFIQSCEMLELSRGGTQQGTLGLFNWDPPGNDGKCAEIPDDIDDKALNCARYCSIIALCCGGVLFVFGFFKQCICPLPCTQLLMDISSTCVQICLALVYVMWFNEACDLYSCSYGDGGTLLIITQCLWLIAGCFSRCMREGRSERNSGGGRRDDE